MNILLIEDDLELGNGMRMALQHQALEVVWVRRLNDAREQLSHSTFDILLLDLGLPDGDGMALLRELRRQRQQVPVLILTARDALEQRLDGLDSGADDYLVKPFALAELLSRVRALARRSYGMVDQGIEVRGLALLEDARRVTVHGEEIDLSPSEFDILALLLKRLDRVVTRRLLEEQVLNDSLTAGSNALDVHVSNLRKKIGEGFIRTVRGVGYVIDRQRHPRAGS